MFGKNKIGSLEKSLLRSILGRDTERRGQGTEEEEEDSLEREEEVDLLKI